MNSNWTSDVIDEQKSVRDLADAIGAEVYNGYSGRGMFGKQCLGISCDDAHDVISSYKEFGLPRPSVDNLGRGWIVYWPTIPAVS